MGNDREVENSVSRKGYTWQALLLAHIQKSRHFNWAYTKVNTLWFLGGNSAFVSKLLHVQIGHLCLGTGCVGRDRSTFTCLLPTATNLSET